MLEAESNCYKEKTSVIYQAMNSQKNCQEIYATLYYDNILPCLNGIFKGEFCFAYENIAITGYQEA